MFVDADSCPVKSEIVEVAKDYVADVTFIASYAHVSETDLGAKWIFVDSAKEAVDLHIMNKVCANDVVVTQDHGLASILLPKGVVVISPRGKIYHENNMDLMLQLRYISAKERRAGHHSKGPKAFSSNDRNYFIKSFKKILSKLAGIKS
ncbi:MULTISPECIES: YaiI/YqxD family protein [Bacillaceae]|uniref:YaiI/YqxD family protein n=1 Tax=Bacillaceae TaxID=186817 RepID=UPI002A0F0894|nr:YaiI/YqxD family protein [Cytobacillus sp. IB215316]MDX8359556.1 YaiI/YqxD family protein [Cytobacillus sp. IB215316]